MIADLKPYPVMRNSCVPWLGAVPTHWCITPLRHLTICLDGKRVPLEASVRGKMLGAYPYWGANQIIDRVNSYLFDEDLILLGEDGAPFFDPYRPVAFFSSGKVWPNNHIHVLRPRGPSRPELIVEALNCVDYAYYVEGATRDKLTQDRMKAIPIPIPPSCEQTAIIRFLDRADRRIRRYISAKQKLIALLEEQKQAIIHQAVTGRIDVRTGRPYPIYKPSGVEWLGDVPEHWQVKRSKRVFMPRTELARANDIQLSATQAYGVISQQRYEETVGRKVVRILRHLEQRRHVEVDDFVISMRSFQGGLERAWESGCIRSSYIVLRPATKLIVAYFGYLFKSVGYINAIQATANFIRDGQDLNFENYCRVDLPFPFVEEQQGIAQFLDQTTTAIRSTVERYRGQVELVREYRRRLIADVVTGKLDVREAADGLPAVDTLAAEDVPDDSSDPEVRSDGDQVGVTDQEAEA